MVLRSNDVCFLGIVRSLAAAGLEAIAITFTWPGAGPWHSELSRHLGEVHVIPNPFQFADAARDAMIALGETLLARYGERLVVLGSSDTNLVFLFDNLEHLAPFFRFMGDRGLDRGQPKLLHKAHVAERLAAANVALPLTRGCAELSDIDAVCDSMVYPCVYKPAIKDYGQTFYAQHDGNKAISIESPEQLRAALATEIAAGFDLVVQEKVEFDSAADEIPFYLYADESGRVAMAATAIKEVIQPYPFGTATVLRLTYHEELLAIAKEVVDALDYRGILMIELIRDRKDDRWKVIELNPRPWLFVDFFRRSGLNYLGCLAEDRDSLMAKRGEPARPTPVASGAEPVHVSLPTACGPYLDSLDRPPTAADVGTWLDGVDGALSLTFYDPDDPQPGLAELGMFAESRAINAHELLEVVRERLGDA